MNIYESIAAIQADVDFIGKDKTTQSGSKFKYRGVDQVLNTLHPLFAKHKVFAVPEVLEILTREERATNSGSKVLYEVLKVKYTFYAEDGTSVSAVVVGEAMDSGDKVSNKCMSVAYKYACFQLLSIPTEETTADPDDSNEQLTPTKSKARRIQELIDGTDVLPKQITEFIVANFGSSIKVNDLTDEQFNKLYSAITQYIKGDNE
ncbi:MAG: ERF family protein [Clostridia bacterium]|nr:ERF family protein [Clostridia bacterium]